MTLCCYAMEYAKYFRRNLLVSATNCDCRYNCNILIPALVAEIKKFLSFFLSFLCPQCKPLPRK